VGVGGELGAQAVRAVATGVDDILLFGVIMLLVW
jgi:hypothetical protein